MSIGLRWVAVAFAVTAACGGSTNDGRGESQAGGSSNGDGGLGGTTSTGGRSGTGAPGGTGAVGGTSIVGGTGAAGGLVGAGASLPCDHEVDPRCMPTGTIPPGPSLCGGVECGAGETCCLTSMKCVNALAADACEIPVPPEPDQAGRASCASNAHCPASEFCAPGAPSTCGGGGFCEARNNCGASGGSLFCGCDGKTYPDLQTACLAGVRALHRGGCGDQVVLGVGGAGPGITRTLCGSDAQCPAGERCCAITGFCYDEAHAALCAYAPPGTTSPCLSNADCSSQSEFCDGAGCDEPGGCKERGECDALLEPVCGCDGKSYVNAPCASSKGVRVASEGECAKPE